MRKFSSRLISALLAAVMLIMAAPAALAEGLDAAPNPEGRFDEGAEAAWELYELGLFRGVGVEPDGTPDFDLMSTTTRGQAVTMLVRILGGEREAVLADYAHPFTDTKGYSSQYAGYAWYHGITKGTDGTHFSPSNKMVLNQFLTLVLRALGYEVPDYKNPYPIADAIGLKYPSGEDFYRADLAVICLSALDVPKSGGGTLREELTKAGAIGAEPVDTSLRFTPGPVIEAVTSFNVSSPLELADKAAAATMGHAQSFEITVTGGNAGSVYESFYENYYERFLALTDATDFTVEYWKDHITFTPLYRDAVQVMGLMEGRGGQWTSELRELLNRAKAALAQIADPTMSEYELVLAIHDYLVQHNSYYDDGTPRVHSAAGCLIDGRSVCEGYMLSFDLMCYLCGIECVQVTGYAVSSLGGSSHGWNKVKVDGKWYNVDVTWDDPVPLDGIPVLTHEYFLVSDDFISQDHSWVSSPAAPVCGENYNG